MQLNEGWNAEPNAPDPLVSVEGGDVILDVKPNPYQFPEYAGIRRIRLTFRNCWRYRLGSVNDEGWYRGQCRFSSLAPKWGEFYEVSGDLRLDDLTDWVDVGQQPSGSRHFLFYLRDEEFECDAEGWTKEDLE